MMRKIALASIIFFLLVGCTPTTPTPTLEPTAQAVKALTTPAYGAVTVLSGMGYVSLPLRSEPRTGAKATGQVKPDDKGKLLGTEASGLWMLVEIEQQTGWIPIQYLDYTIAQ